MILEGYRYKFLSGEALNEAERILLLATLAAVGLHGESRIRMDAAYAVDGVLNTIAVDASTEVGQDIANIFTAFLTKGLGQNKFLVHRLSALVEVGQ